MKEQETVQIWCTEPCNVQGIWFKALNFFILVMALSTWIRIKGIVWLSLTSASVEWAPPPRNEWIFNLRVLVHFELWRLYQPWLNHCHPRDFYSVYHFFLQSPCQILILRIVHLWMYLHQRMLFLAVPYNLHHAYSGIHSTLEWQGRWSLAKYFFAVNNASSWWVGCFECFGHCIYTWTFEGKKKANVVPIHNKRDKQTLKKIIVQYLYFQLTVKLLKDFYITRCLVSLLIKA